MVLDLDLAVVAHCSSKSGNEPISRICSPSLEISIDYIQFRIFTDYVVSIPSYTYSVHNPVIKANRKASDQYYDIVLLNLSVLYIFLLSPRSVIIFEV